MLDAIRSHALANPFRRSGFAAVAVALLLIVGCHSSRRHHTTVVIDPVPADFVYEAHVFHADFEDAYLWFNPFDEALVDLTVDDFYGELLIIVEDATGYEIYRDHLFGFGGSVFVEGITDFGIPGDWVIRIIGFDLTADLALVVYP